MSAFEVVVPKDISRLILAGIKEGGGSGELIWYER